MTLKTLGVILQNNQQAKSYVMEKTNIANYLINVLSKSINTNQLSAALFAYGSLMRNNRQLSSEIFKKGTSMLIEIIASESEISLSMKTKALVLIDDLLNSEESRDQDYSKMLDNLKICKYLEKFFILNRNGFISDIDSVGKTIISLNGPLKDMCQREWSESPMFRHTLLVLLNNYKMQLDILDEDVRFVYLENVALLETLNQFLYGELKINDDDLSHKLNDEL